MNRTRIDITGQSFGRLTALRPEPNGMWTCSCVCGGTTLVTTTRLRVGRTRSCGCLWREANAAKKVPRVDLGGRLFGRLTVLGSAGVVAGRTRWACACSCSAIVRVPTFQLLRDGRGKRHSCGCLGQEHGRTHGQSRRRDGGIYGTWANMISRCHNPRVGSFRYYGAKGVKVCGRWRDSFANFLADVGEKPSPELTLDRIDPAGDYEPSNVRWATRLEQARNKRPREVSP